MTKANGAKGGGEAQAKTIFADGLREHQQLCAVLEQQQQAFVQAVEILVTCLRAGGRVFFCGNGGSAADAQHLAAEFEGRFEKERRPLAALALNTNTSSITAIANDYGFEQIYARMLTAHARPGDVLVAISTSGNSRNVLAAVAQAKSLGVRCVGMCGNAGALSAQCDCTLAISSTRTARIQEGHILLGHLLCECVEKALC